MSLIYNKDINNNYNNNNNNKNEPSGSGGGGGGGGTVYTKSSPWFYEPFIYRIFYGSSGNEQPIVQQVCAERGWHEFADEQKKLTGGSALGWNLWWRCTTLNVNPLRTLFSWQFTNQIPRAIGFCNKEYLRHFFVFLKKEFGSISDFGPTTFILPNEWDLLKRENDARTKLGCSNDTQKIKHIKNLIIIINNTSTSSSSSSSDKNNNNNNKNKPLYKPLWITKPVGKSQGKGISITDDINSLLLPTIHITTTVVQEYIARPLLIGGYKFDLRLYVCVTSTNPVTLYVYREGLTRFATQKYDVHNLTNLFSHLTNASLNKYSSEYMMDKEYIGYGCKWTFTKLRQYFKSINIQDFYLWQRIWSILIVTVIGECNRMACMPYTRNCFAFLGYDILIDENMRPYLLEVNLAPGLNADSDVDTKVKKPMLHDMFNLIGLPNEPAKRRKNLRVDHHHHHHQHHHHRPFSQSINLRRIENTSDFVPSNYFRPSTVEKAMSLVSYKNQYKFYPGSKLRQRLIDMTAIYTQDLAGQLKKIQKQNLDGTLNNNNNNNNGLNKRNTSSKSKKERYPSYITRDWVDPIAKCGDWVRVFPFDSVSQTESRRSGATMDLRLMASRLYIYLQDVRDLVIAHPFRSDEYYINAIKKMNKIDTEIWLPPTPTPEPNHKSEPSTTTTTTTATTSENDNGVDIEIKMSGGTEETCGDTETGGDTETSGETVGDTETEESCIDSAPSLIYDTSTD